MLLSFYGLSRNPFAKGTKETDRFLSRDMTEMTSRLEYLKENRGIGVFTAYPGMGKSYCLRCFARNLNQNQYHMEYICLSTVSVRDFYRQLCEVLGISGTVGKTGMFKAIQEQIWYLYKEKRQPLLLAVDEAQYLSLDILKELKMLMNFGYDSLNCFSLILVGEPHLNNTLCRPIHEDLHQRIVVHYNFAGLSDEEVPRYIAHKITCAGGSEAIIDKAAVSAVHGYSNGNPRLIDNVMTDALILGAQQGKEVIDADVIYAAVNNQKLG